MDTSDPSQFDGRDVPATQVGGEEGRSPPRQVGRMTEHMRLRVGDHTFDLSVLADPQHPARLVTAADWVVRSEASGASA